MTFKKVLLTKEEKKLIKRIMRVQIRNLERIRVKDCPMDITLMMLQEGINEEDYMEGVDKSLKIFREIKENPSRMFDLDEEDISITKHIMFNFANHPKYDVGKKRVWRKLILMELLPICPQ